MAKQKLLMIVGAGASIEFGMPSVGEVGETLSEAAQKVYPLARRSKFNLYDYLEHRIQRHWSATVPQHLQRAPHFEDVLYLIYMLSSVFPQGAYTSPLGASVFARPLPEVLLHGRTRTRVDGETLRQFGGFLVDNIVRVFRNRSKCVEVNRPHQMRILRDFIGSLEQDFEIAIVTLNYDNVLLSALDRIETGFDVTTGWFDSARVINRKDWPCILHMHGSIHFDMPSVQGHDLHEIKWQNDLDGTFQQNASGRSRVPGSEGIPFPVSILIAGYGKTIQLMDQPFRTYYSELDRLVGESDALLFTGYGFNDEHLNRALKSTYKNKVRPVVMVDFSSDNGYTTNGLHMGQGDTTRDRMIDVLGVRCEDVQWRDHTAPNLLKELKLANEIEISIDAERPLAIWHNGMLEACIHLDRWKSHLLGRSENPGCLGGMLGLHPSR